MSKSKRTKRPTGSSLDCICGAKAAVFELEKGYMAHCPNCGAVPFFDNPILASLQKHRGVIVGQSAPI